MPDGPAPHTPGQARGGPGGRGAARAGAKADISHSGTASIRIRGGRGQVVGAHVRTWAKGVDATSMLFQHNAANELKLILD